MFDYLVQENKLMQYFGEYGLKEQEVDFIKEQIKGQPLNVCLV